MLKNKILTEDLFQKINGLLFPELKNKKFTQNQLIITFSGVPGTGKTSIAKKLENRYRAVRINNDYIRNVIDENHLASSKKNGEQLLQEYNFYLLTRLPFPNKRIILDKSMDRRYTWFLDVCRNNNINYFLIRLDVSDFEKGLEMLSKREKITEREINSMKRWCKEYIDCAKNLEADITLDAVNPDLKKLFRKLDNITVKPGKKSQ